MKTKTAHRINDALCRVWFCRHVTGREPLPDDLNLLRQASLGQLQTASEVIQAENAAALVGGPSRCSCFVDDCQVGQLKAWVDALNLR